MKVAIIDPSGFTPSYDHCIADALENKGSKVLLFTTQISLSRWAHARRYELCESFYRVTNKVTKSRLRMYLKGLEHIWDMGKLVENLRQKKPDVIHFQWIPVPALDSMFIQKLRKVAPLIFTVHDTEPFLGAPSSMLQLVGLESAFRKFDHYIVHTEYSKKMLLHKMRLPGTRVTVIPHGDFSYYRELVIDRSGYEKKVISGGAKRVLFFGVLKPYKGVDILIEAFARLPEPLLRNAVLQIVGMPKMPIEPLITLVRQRGIEARIIWDLRFVNEEEVGLYFEQADVVVLPYRRIDQSGVLMIALAFGKPIVASHVGGVAEIIKDGIHGFLVEKENIESLSTALERILIDDDLRMRMAKEVQMLSNKELSWERIAEKTIEIYNSVIKERNRIRDNKVKK